MANDLTYLTKEQVTGLRNNQCLCCNEKFPTHISERTTTHESDDHGITSEYQRTTITSTILDLDVYLLRLEPPQFPGLDQKMKEIRTKLETKIKHDASQLEQDLEIQLTIPKEKKQQVITCAVQDALKSLEPTQSHFYPYRQPSALDKKVGYLEHSLTFGDLHERTMSYNSISSKPGASNAYNPGCLKTHITCWPFEQKPDLNWRTVEISHGKLYATITTLPLFQNYPQCIEDAKEVLEWLKPQPINIIIKRYNPLDYMGIK